MFIVLFFSDSTQVLDIYIWTYGSPGSRSTEGVTHGQRWRARVIKAFLEPALCVAGAILGALIDAEVDYFVFVVVAFTGDHGAAAPLRRITVIPGHRSEHALWYIHNMYVELCSTSVYIARVNSYTVYILRTVRIFSATTVFFGDL